MNEKRYPSKYQLACIGTTCLQLANSSTAYIEMPYYTGKTYTSYWIDKSLHNNITVIFVSSHCLASHFFTDWNKQSDYDKIDTKYLFIRSTEDINKKKFQNYIIKCRKKLVIICTYQNSHILASVCKNIIFDFAIFDEATKLLDITDDDFSILLDDKIISAKKKLFITGIPVSTKETKGKKQIIRLNDDQYIKNIYKQDIGYAITCKQLTDYQCISVTISTDDVNGKIGNYKKELSIFDMKDIGTLLVLFKKIHDGTCNHIIIHTPKKSSVSNFFEIASIMKKKLNNNVFIGKIYEDDLFDDQQKMITKFSKANGGIMISNITMTEEYHIPIIDGICFEHSKRNDILQYTYQCLRLNPNKKMANIIIPIVNNDNKTKKILRYLAEMDDRIEKYMKGEKIKIMINEPYKKINMDSVFDQNEWKKMSFYDKCDLVKKWTEQNGRIPKSHSNGMEKNLEYWCSNQRRQLDKLDEDKINKLNEIPGWFTERNDNFDEKYNATLKWINTWMTNNKSIDAKLPSSKSKDEDEKTLGLWCVRVRKHQNKLSKDKIKKLDKLPGWYWKKKNPFDKNYQKLTAWIKENGKIPSRRDDQVLGEWCNKQRANRKKLTKEQHKKLDNIPEWFWSKDDVVAKEFSAYKKWVIEHNRFPDIESKNELEQCIAHWKKYKQIKKERIYKNINEFNEKIIKKWNKENKY